MTANGKPDWPLRVGLCFFASTSRRSPSARSVAGLWSATSRRSPPPSLSRLSGCFASAAGPRGRMWAGRSVEAAVGSSVGKGGYVGRAGVWPTTSPNGSFLTVVGPQTTPNVRPISVATRLFLRQHAHARNQPAMGFGGPSRRSGQSLCVSGCRPQLSKAGTAAFAGGGEPRDRAGPG